jgi:exodeoxyribonuclease V alpha subunit
MYRGTTGVDRLNRLCQEELNTNTRGIVHRGTQLYLGDRVINLENNYDKMIFNGDCGIITGVDPARRNLTVKFADRAITFESDELDNLKLSYAITIHKSQGSEYPAVIIPILGEHYLMLRRNLLYTAISRGRQLVVLIGSKKALQQAVRNHQEIARLTLLPYFLEKNQHSKYPANS